MNPIVVALGEPAASQHVLELAVNLAKQRDAELVLTHARVHASEPSVEKKLAELRTKLQTQGLTVSTEIQTTLMGDEAEFIAETARDRDAQLIVMGSRGRTPLSGALLGSTSQDILHVTPCPVVIVPDHGHS